MNEQPVCFRCGRTPEQIGEYVSAAREDNEDNQPTRPPVSATEWMLANEGTYNPKTNHFACTECYIAIGMPSGRAGHEPRWIAP